MWNFWILWIKKNCSDFFSSPLLFINSRHLLRLLLQALYSLLRIIYVHSFLTSSLLFHAFSGNLFLHLRTNGFLKTRLSSLLISSLFFWILSIPIMPRLDYLLLHCISVHSVPCCIVCLCTTISATSSTISGPFLIIHVSVPHFIAIIISYHHYRFQKLCLYSSLLSCHTTLQTSLPIHPAAFNPMVYFISYPPISCIKRKDACPVTINLFSVLYPRVEASVA